jgi:site-specific recombinase XerD
VRCSNDAVRRVQIARRLAFRESSASRPLALPGTTDHAAHILPVARKLSINKRIGWHTFRHTYSTLPRSTGAELEIMQELLRHSTIRATLDTYTQAVTTEGRSAQEAVVARLCPRKTPE